MFKVFELLLGVEMDAGITPMAVRNEKGNQGVSRPRKKPTLNDDVERVSNRSQITVSMPVQLFQEAEKFLEKVPMKRSEAFSAAMVMFLGATPKEQERAVGALAALAMRDHLMSASASLDEQRQTIARLLENAPDS